MCTYPVIQRVSCSCASFSSSILLVLRLPCCESYSWVVFHKNCLSIFAPYLCSLCAGLILADSANMVMRIGYSWRFIRLMAPHLQLHEWAPSLRSCGCCAVAAVTLRESSIMQCMERMHLQMMCHKQHAFHCSQAETVEVWHAIEKHQTMPLQDASVFWCLSA